MRIKRLLSLALASLTVLSLAAGCSRKTADNTASIGAAPQPQDIKASITLWAPWAENQGPDTWISEFNKVYPNIKIEYVKYTNDDPGNTKIDTSLLAGVDVDVFFNCGVKRIDPRARKGLIQDLSAYIKRDNFDPAKEYGSNIYTLGSKYYGLPVGVISDYVAVNMDALKSAGLTLPTSWDLTEYKDYATRLTSGSGAKKVYGTCDFSDIAYWAYPAYSLLGANPWYNSKGLSNWDNSAYTTALQFKYDMESKDQVQYSYKDMTAQSLDPSQVMLKGMSNMAVLSSAFVRNFKDTKTYPRSYKVGFAPIPVIDKAKDTGGTNGTYYFDYLSMSSKLSADKKEACWAFMKWIGSTGNTMLASVGHIPAWKSADKEKVIATMVGSNADQIIDESSFKNVVLSTNRAKDYDLTQFDAYNQMYTIMKEEAQLALYGNETVSQAISKMKQRSDEAIKAAQSASQSSSQTSQAASK